MKAVAVYNIKGGVGKTATAVNLAAIAASEGHRTLVWDLDPQGAASFYFRVRPELDGGPKALLAKKKGLARHVKATDRDLLDLLPADFGLRDLDLALDGGKKPRARLARLLKPLSADYDLVILDCAPSISLTSESIFRAVDALLVPTIPTTLSERTLEALAGFLQEGGEDAPRILPFFSMVDARKRLHREVVARLRDHTPKPLETVIPYASEVEQMGLHRDAVLGFSPRGRPTRAFRALLAELLEALRSRA